MRCSACGKHIVNEDHGATRDFSWAGSKNSLCRGESSLKIDEPLGSSKMGLARGRKEADEGFYYRESEELSCDRCDFLGLVEASLAVPGRVCGDWDKDGVCQTADALVFLDCLRDHSSNRVAQPELSLVFEAVDHISGHTAVVVLRSGEVECQITVVTVRALKPAAIRAVRKGLSTDLAAAGDNRIELVAATRADNSFSPAAPMLVVTGGTALREDEVERDLRKGSFGWYRRNRTIC